MIETSAANEKPIRPPETPLVLLVVPPFQGLRCPALGASQLKADLLHNGIRSEVLYLNMRFAERLTPRAHEWISATGKALLGEFVFSCVAHDKGEEELVAYHDELIRDSHYAATLRQWFPDLDPLSALRHMVDEARQFIANEAIDEILARDPWMVGFSSTFQSNCCSLALIKEIKRRRPEILTVIGGANCEGEQGEELIACYPEIDFVGRGECDFTFPELVRSLLDGEQGSDKVGFLRQGHGLNCPSPPLNGQELDTLPYPDFFDYFEQLESFKHREQVVPGLAMETSRGCWWGAKQHCTFCAFNREGMAFRAKGPERAAAEMEELVRRHGLRRMEITDNILDMGYFKSLLPKLADSPVAEFFWETKSNLTRDQMYLMKEAGIGWIQPGLESLSDQTLRLMKKGTTQIQNTQTLKWGLETGIFVNWNWLFGFPGESEEELEKLADVARSVYHLQPPQSAPVLYLERFSPYHSNPEQWDLEPIWASPAYGHVYPFSEESLDRIAFFFDCEFLLGKEKGAAFSTLSRVVRDWQNAYPYSHLLMVPTQKSLLLIDTRRNGKKWVRRLRGLERDIYDYCWKMRSPQDIERTFGERAEPGQVEAILKDFVDDELVMYNAKRFLSLAVDPRVRYRDFPATFPGGQFVFPSERRAERRRWIVDGLLLRRPLGETITELGRRLRVSLTQFGVRTLIRNLPQPASPPDEPKTVKAASQAA